MPKRRLTAVAVRVAGRVYLFDCGEGTQIPYKELHLGQRALTLIAVTHLHADHCLGLPGMLMLRAQMPDPEPLTLIGPPGLGRFVDHVREDLALYINYEIRVFEWSPGGSTLAYQDEHLRVLWAPLDHSVLCLGYRIEEHDRPGRFDPEAARQLGVPEGPLWGALQRGETVQARDGTEVRPEQVLGPARRGVHLAFVTDTAPTTAMDPLLEEADLALVEAMFLSEHEAEAESKRHMTAAQAGRAAERARAAELLLVHLSPRYEARDEARFIEEARAHHPRARVARDSDVIEVLARDA
jgi:ribonuclease Z